MTKLEKGCPSIFRVFGQNYPCQLPKGHGGKHTFGMTWTDKESVISMRNG